MINEISAKLIKSLERKGFSLEFPEYNSNEEIILDIIKQHNLRLNLSIPIFLKERINYKEIIKKLSILEKKEFDKILLISYKIYKQEQLLDALENLNKIIKENKIPSDFSINEFKKYSDSFKESQIKSENEEQEIIRKQSKLRLNLDLNKSLSTLFSPAKIKIMDKIFNHQKLSNTELKYYYRAISNINRATLNPDLREYLRIIEITKKIHPSR
ncbi:hypothetical protein J4465_02350 [Candidatus Pacearchaeota archaeon]|nr:hypothetical protein [Candidatus Pacearchaeota archaeon]